MAVYQGVVHLGRLIRRSDRRIRVINYSRNYALLQFPADVTYAVALATPRFIGDRITPEPFVIWSVDDEPNQLYFEQDANNGFCFRVDTARLQSVAEEESKKAPRGKISRPRKTASRRSPKE